MLTIRPMTAADDFSAAARVYVESWQYAYKGLVAQHYLDKLRPEGWTGVMRADPSANLIALLDGRTIGVAYVTYARDEGRAGYGELVSLYLLPAMAGKGFGKQLLLAVLDKCRQDGMTAVCLWVLTHNDHARRFYERMGFGASGRTKTEAIGGDLLPLTEYTLPLE